MESLLSGSKLAEELEFVKRHAELIATQKLKYASTYVPPLEHRQKKATLADVSSPDSLLELGTDSLSCSDSRLRTASWSERGQASSSRYAPLVTPSNDSCSPVALQRRSPSPSNLSSPLSSLPSPLLPPLPSRPLRPFSLRPNPRPLLRMRSAGFSRAKQWATASSCASLQSRTALS